MLASWLIKWYNCFRNICIGNRCIRNKKQIYQKQKVFGNGGLRVKKLGTITIFTAIILNIMGNNVVAKNVGPEVSINIQGEAKPDALQSVNTSWSFSYTHADKDIYNPSVSFQPKQEFAGYNPWWSPGFDTQKQIETPPNYTENNPWSPPKMDIPSMGSNPVPYMEYNPWMPPTPEVPTPMPTPTPVATPTPVPYIGYNPWIPPTFEAPTSAATPIPYMGNNLWKQPNMEIPAKIPYNGYNPWMPHMIETPTPIPTPTPTPVATPTPTATPTAIPTPVPYIGYNPWIPSQAVPPTPAATTAPYFGYNPWGIPPMETPKPAVTPMPYTGYYPWVPPMFNIPNSTVYPYGIYNPWAMYSYPYGTDVHKDNDTKGATDSQTENLKNDYSLELSIGGDLSFDWQLAQVNYELEKARQKLSNLRNNSKQKIDAAIKQTRYKISSIVNNDDLDSNIKKSEIKKLKSSLENEIKNIKEDAAKQAKIIIDNQNTTIKNIFKAK